MKKFFQEIWFKPTSDRKDGNKIKLSKLKNRAECMISAMPLDNGERWWLKLLAQDNLDKLVKEPEQICPESFLNYLDYMEAHCETLFR